MDKKVFLAIDANAIIHRAFHAYPGSLMTDDGVQVNAVYGFTTMLLAALERFDPDYVMCAMDTHAPTFRHAMYSDYKATRKPTDQSLIDQFPLVEEVLKAFNIPVIKKEGYEADDILGTVSKYVDEGVWSNEDVDMYILSGDKDLLQLIKPRVWVCLPNGGFKNLIVYDREMTFEKYGYYPEQVVDYKGVVGDNSDNIPGIKGVGDKTALNLLQKYGDLNTIFKHLDEIPSRFQKLFAEGVEQAEFSRELATINRDVDINIHMEDCLLKDFNRVLLVSTFKRFGFKSLVLKLDDVFGQEEKVVNTAQLDMFSATSSDYEWSDKDVVIERVESAKYLRIVYINSEESYDGEAFFMIRVINVDNSVDDLLCKPFDIFPYIVDKESVFYNFEELVTLSDTQVKGEYPLYLDVLLLEHILNSEKRNLSLNGLAFDYSSQVISEKIAPNQYKLVLDVVEEVYFTQLEKVKSFKLNVYTKDSISHYFKGGMDPLLLVLRYLELPVSVILSKMEERGIALDWDRLNALKVEIDGEVSKVESDIYDIVGHEFNINSPKQLSDVLFNELGLPSSSKGSTKESVLQGLVGTHPIIEPLLYYREVTKVRNTYVEPLLRDSSEVGGLHVVNTDFKQTGTTSGRFSSVNPNMQNLPLDGDWATKVRECFVARKGFKLLAVDYSQMELRIMADISKDDLLMKDFIDKVDVHTATAARVLDKPLDEVSSKERKIGKTVNFGMIFGQTGFGLARLLGISKELAFSYIQSYFENYSGVEEYMRRTEHEAFTSGYVQSMFGTTRHVAGIRSKNKRLRAAAAREAINMPIQGSEADIMKFVMVRISELINEKYQGQAFMLLQIHDEIVFEVEEGVSKEFAKEVEYIMLNSFSFDVPLEVHTSLGYNLSELK